LRTCALTLHLDVRLLRFRGQREELDIQTADRADPRQRNREQEEPDVRSECRERAEEENEEPGWNLRAPTNPDPEGGQVTSEHTHLRLLRNFRQIE
jgi:hypothetical protein